MAVVILKWENLGPTRRRNNAILKQLFQEVMEPIKSDIDKVVIASWRRHPMLNGESGTSVKWLSLLDGVIKVSD